MPTNLFNGKRIVEDPTLTPSDGSAPGSSAIFDGLGKYDTDIVLTVLNPSSVPVQLMWADNNVRPFKWAPIGDPSTKTQQTSMRLRTGFSYRFEAFGVGVFASFEKFPEEIPLRVINHGLVEA